MMLATKFDFTRLMPSATESPFEYWVSLSPAAPFFGIKWRFADMMFGEEEHAAHRTPAPVPEPVTESAKIAEALAPVPEDVAPGEEEEPEAEPAGADDLTAIKGVGPKMATALEAEGITTYRQIAAWSPEDIEALEARIGAIPGRILRDDWIGQAKALAG